MQLLNPQLQLHHHKLSLIGYPEDFKYIQMFPHVFACHYNLIFFYFAFLTYSFPRNVGCMPALVR